MVEFGYKSGKPLRHYKGIVLYNNMGSEKMVKEMIKWKSIIIGIFIAIALYAVSNILSGLNITLIDFLLAGIAVGLWLGVHIKDGALNGTIFGFIGGVIVTLIILINHYALSGYGSYWVL